MSSNVQLIGKTSAGVGSSVQVDTGKILTKSTVDGTVTLGAAASTTIGIVKLDTTVNTVKLDTSNNTVKLDTSNNTVKLDASNNTVTLVAAGTPSHVIGTVKIDSTDNAVTTSASALTTTNTELEAATTVTNTSTETTASTDLAAVRRCAIFGSLDDSGGNIVVEVSADNSAFFQNTEQSIFISNGVYYKTIELDARYIRFKYTNNSGSSKSWTCNLSRKS